MSQIKSIRHYLESGGKITPLEALDKFNCMRLAAVIHTLREEGLEVMTKTIKNGKKSYAQYYLEHPTGNKDQYKLFGGTI
tara:strand:- start:807 stop:1046 length:240 start_codon:yes stop_codon:yes gene_type:complete